MPGTPEDLLCQARRPKASTNGPAIAIVRVKATALRNGVPNKNRRIATNGCPSVVQSMNGTGRRPPRHTLTTNHNSHAMTATVTTPDTALRIESARDSIPCTGHGLTQHAQVLAPLLDTTTGDAEGMVSMTARDAALRLLGAPLAAVTVVSEVFPVCGWSVPEAEVKQILFVWGRIAHVPHPDDPTT